MSVKGLKYLPRELISQILQCDIHYSALDLWKCGDVQLNYILATGGVTEVVLKNNNATAQNRWPSILQYFRKLTLLAIRQPDARIGDIEYVRHSLMQLSPTVRTLELSFKNAEEAILESLESGCYISHLWSSDDDIQDIHPSDPIQSSICNNSNMRRLWPLKEKFPNLQNLTIVSFGMYKTQFDLDGLPEGLISLKIHCFMSWELKNTEVLPRTLEKLDLLNLKIVDSQTLKHLPPGLRSLNQTINWNNNDLKLIEHLPSTLTELGYFIPYDHRKLDFTLPPNLTSLNLTQQRELNPEWLFNTLPSSLTQLSLGNLEYTEALALALPSGLKHLHLGRYNTKMQKAPILPSRLTTFRYPRPITKVSDFVSSLPSTLTSLTVGAIESCLAPTLINGLPRGLLDLFSTDEIYFFSEACKTTSRYCLPSINFPPGLTTLSFVQLAMKSDDQPDMATQFVRLLPRSLTDLSISLTYPDPVNLNESDAQEGPVNARGETWLPDSVSALPPSLRQLYIRKGIQIAGYHYYLLPRGLTSYYVCYHQHLVPILHHHLAMLPPDLIIYDQSSPPMLEKMISFGPPEDVSSIKSKKDAISPFIITDPIRQRFILPLNSTYEAPSNWATFLPKTLKRLHLMIHLNGADCAQLPRSIRLLKVATIRNVTPEQIRMLPTRLSHLEANLIFQPSVRPLTPADLPPLLNYASLNEYTHIWRAYKSWNQRLRNHPPLPYALAFPSTPSDPVHLQKRLHLD